MCSWFLFKICLLELKQRSLENSWSGYDFLLKYREIGFSNALTDLERFQHFRRLILDKSRVVLSGAATARIRARKQHAPTVFSWVTVIYSGGGRQHQKARESRVSCREISALPFAVATPPRQGKASFAYNNENLNKACTRTPLFFF